MEGDPSLQQLANVATLPGIQREALAMPDIHFGYGFPVGGVAAFDLTEGVVSPGGIGYDINCGVRLIRTSLTVGEVRPVQTQLLDSLYRSVPSGVGSKGGVTLSGTEIDEVLAGGARWAVERGFGRTEDLTFQEEEGRLANADPSHVGAGRPQAGAPAARDPRVREPLPRGPGGRSGVRRAVREGDGSRPRARGRHAPHRLPGPRTPGRDRLHPPHG